MFMAALPFATPSAAEPYTAHRVGPLRVVEVDLSLMFKNIFTEGDSAQLPPWWRDAHIHVRVRSPSSTPLFRSFLKLP